MIERRLAPVLEESLERFPVVALLGARQVGKTTLAKKLADARGASALYLDLERPSDEAKLQEAEAYLQGHAGKLVILDEIQRRPDLFPILRSLVDEQRRCGRFLILGSASPHLLRSSSESLAGRITQHELAPLTIWEVGSDASVMQRLWARGGFPGSFLGESDAVSAQWRESFVATHLERDIPVLGIHIPAATLRRFWTMLAHVHGQMWNASRIAGSLGVSAPAARRYLDILQDTFMVRQLQPYHANVKKRLIKSPKVYLRDSGLLHALLGLDDLDELLAHPVAGHSWEGWVMEQMFSLLPRHWQAWFYRTSAGAEIDLLLARPKGGWWAFEIKLTCRPSLTKGFLAALSDFDDVKGFIVCPVEERFPLGRGVEALPVRSLPGLFSSEAGNSRCEIRN